MTASGAEVERFNQGIQFEVASSLCNEMKKASRR
jgi:hypothetical protein